MAWDPPALFSVSEVVTAAKMNQIRDSLLYLKGQAGTIVPEAVISPVRNDAASSYTLERTSATARKYGLLVGASGDFGIDDLTAAARRLTISSSGQVSIPGDTLISGIATTSSRLNANAYAGSNVPAFGVGQANAAFIFVSVEGITSGTATLATGIASGVFGQAFAVGSTTGFTNGGSSSVGAAKPGAGSTTLITYAAAFVLEITSGGVLQARRTAGSETWSIHFHGAYR